MILSRSLIFCMDNPLLLTALKTNKEPQRTFRRFIPLSGLARVRKDDATASIFGGNDKPVIIASGRSVNPTFFSFRKGSAILESVRMSASFFNTGYFRRDGVKCEGTTYLLHEQRDAFYYQPLPGGERDRNGNYVLSESLDGRFWSKMSFGSRPTTELCLRSGGSLEGTVPAHEADDHFLKYGFAK
jgi:hypothetical protein